MSVEEVEGVEHSQYSGEGSLCWFGITHMVLLQRAPPSDVSHLWGHVVTFHFHSFGLNKDKSIH